MQRKEELDTSRSHKLGIDYSIMQLTSNLRYSGHNLFTLHVCSRW